MMRVYNFLAAQWAEDDLAKNRIKISRFDDLNDPFELLAAQLRSRDPRWTAENRPFVDTAKLQRRRAASW
jgi:hypothetical protein